jgi:hypothetical protein
MNKREQRIRKLERHFFGDDDPKDRRNGIPYVEFVQMLQYHRPDYVAQIPELSRYPPLTPEVIRQFERTERRWAAKKKAAQEKVDLLKAAETTIQVDPQFPDSTFPTCISPVLTGVAPDPATGGPTQNPAPNRPKETTRSKPADKKS